MENSASTTPHEFNSRNYGVARIKGKVEEIYANHKLFVNIVGCLYKGIKSDENFPLKVSFPSSTSIQMTSEDEYTLNLSLHDDRWILMESRLGNTEYCQLLCENEMEKIRHFLSEFDQEHQTYRFRSLLSYILKISQIPIEDGLERSKQELDDIHVRFIALYNYL